MRRSHATTSILVPMKSRHRIFVATFLLSGFGRLAFGQISYSTPYVITTLAGSWGDGAYADGTGSAALFYQPSCTTVDQNGNIYVADNLNNKIRKVTPAGVVTTFVSYINQPYGIAIDPSGNLYVSEEFHNVIDKISPSGTVSVLAGTSGVTGSADGIGPAAQFHYPCWVAVDPSGNVFVSDWGNNVIRKITPGGSVTTFLGTAGVKGAADGTGAAVKFQEIGGVAADSAGNLYIADAGNSNIRISTPTGNATTFAGTQSGLGDGVGGWVDATGTSAQFAGPTNVTVDSNGNVFVIDGGNGAIRRITPAGVVTACAGAK